MNKRGRDDEGSEGGASGSDARELRKFLDEQLTSRLATSSKTRKEVTDLINTVDPEELLETLCKRWEVDSQAASAGHFTHLALKNFEFDPQNDIDLTAPSHPKFGGGYGLRELDDTIERHEQEAISLFNRIKEIDPTGERPHLQQRAVKVLEMVYYAKRVVLSAFQARLAVHQLHSADHKLAEDLDLLLGSWTVRFRWIDHTKSTPLQKLLLHLLDTAMEKRYRKHVGHVYEPIVIDGHETHAWRMVCDIKEFVYEATKKEMHWEQWCNLTASGNNARLAVEHLTCSNDYQFPFLKKDRSVFAFRNGVYVARDDKFYRFGVGEQLSDNVVAAKFFDTEFDSFDDLGDWRQIPTPNLQRIMDFQEWDPRVQEWMYIMLGRLLYNLREKDHWEVAPFLLGAASSGKSTLTVKVAKLFYEDADVGVLSNNIEKQFGIGAFAKKLLVVAPELKGDLKLEQTEMQSMISGEPVQVAEKHKTAYSAEWRVPVIMAGNDVPAYVDNSGSVQRRFLVFAFNKAVVNGDTKLAEKLAEEITAILVKCNRAYLEAVERYGNSLIWSVVPTYFIDTRNEMAQSVNSVEAFMASPEVVCHPDAFCPWKQFKEAWRAFATANSYKIDKSTMPQYFRAPLGKFNCSIHEKAVTKEYRGARLTDKWVIGVDLATSSGAAFALG